MRGREGGREGLSREIFRKYPIQIFVCRISSMIGTLKCPYPGLTTEITADILTQIQTSIRQKVKLTH